uniref:Caveolin n=1 Tax=Globodera pallida TaxID=36090 RepID=A0A183CGE6_GLOPA
MASDPTPSQPDDSPHPLIYALTPLGRHPPRQIFHRADAVNAQRQPTVQAINPPQALEQPAERDPNAEEHQQTPQQAVEMAENNVSPLRAVKSSPQLTSPNSLDLKRDLRSVLVQQDEQNGESETEIRRSRSDAAIVNLRTYDFPQAVDDRGTGPTPARSCERFPGEDDERGESTIGELKSYYSQAVDAVQWSMPTLLWLWQFRLFRFLVILLTAYFGLGLVEHWAITLTATVVGWAWPPTHLILATTQGCLYYLTDWCSWMDEFLSCSFCDMAASYCRQYGLMCENQCSFVNHATERTIVLGRRF